MLVLIGLIVGAIIGAMTAKRRGGNRLDLLQYAGVFALIGAVIGLFVTVGVERML
ncbi:hypothetical protein [Aliiroseovarius sp. YM-037]|uniref:hypothetical protein n=1 Tax=Aliiroseovarius sp. YM-037 TaxID=3341728 RepID=UPI003A7FCE3F